MRLDGQWGHDSPIVVRLKYRNNKTDMLSPMFQLPVSLRLQYRNELKAIGFGEFDDS